MSMPFYVSPEQLMKDRADFARKGIARGRSVVVLQYDDGIVFVSENPSAALQKISGGVERTSQRDLRQVSAGSALCIAPISLKGLASTHPPLEKRLEQLARIQAELDRPSL